ncbi:MAG: alpha/beta hydrolase [Deltaproteobacteria bacterium]|nr:alpha/beta hydrolase [Deltaproteobacteria bacterium]
MSDGEPDIIAGYLAETLPLPPDEAGPVVATLVHHPEDRPDAPAVLYLHGYNEYWFQEELAERWRGAGFAWFALDLRRHGRSLRQGQHGSYISDMRLYFEELDLAVARIRENAPERPIILLGHSTGGLTSALYADARPGLLQALVLNAPFFGFAGPRYERWVLNHVVSRVGLIEPRFVVQKDGGPVYASSLHRDFGRGGEWTYDLCWKRAGGLPLLAGWIRAVHQGHEAVRRGLEIGCPVLVLSSARSGGGKQWNDSYLNTDAVLDVVEMRRRARRLGPLVEQVVLEGALHDVVLSAAPVRERAYLEMTEWAGRALRADGRTVHTSAPAAGAPPGN